MSAGPCCCCELSCIVETHPQRASQRINPRELFFFCTMEEACRGRSLLASSRVVASWTTEEDTWIKQHRPTAGGGGSGRPTYTEKGGRGGMWFRCTRPECVLHNATGLLYTYVYVMMSLTHIRWMILSPHMVPHAHTTPGYLSTQHWTHYNHTRLYTKPPLTIDHELKQVLCHTHTT